MYNSENIKDKVYLKLVQLNSSSFKFPSVFSAAKQQWMINRIRIVITSLIEPDDAIESERMKGPLSAKTNLLREREQREFREDESRSALVVAKGITQKLASYLSPKLCSPLCPQSTVPNATI